MWEDGIKNYNFPVPSDAMCSFNILCYNGDGVWVLKLSLRSVSVQLFTDMLYLDILLE